MLRPSRRPCSRSFSRLTESGRGHPVMSWYLPPYSNMEVAIVVIVIFVVILLLVIVVVRICARYNCISCCDTPSDTDSIQDVDDELDDDRSDDCGDDEGLGGDDEGLGGDEHHQRPVMSAADVEEELTQGVDYPRLSSESPIVGDGRLQLEEEDGEEFLLNKMEESLL